MFVEEKFVYENCRRCYENADPDSKHVMCRKVNCKRLDEYVASKAKEQEEQKKQS